MFSRELKKGSTELLVLSILESRARHGYDIGKRIEATSGGRLQFRIGSLYPILCRLEDRGLITWPMRVERLRASGAAAFLAWTAPGKRAHWPSSAACGGDLCSPSTTSSEAGNTP